MHACQIHNKAFCRTTNKYIDAKNSDWEYLLKNNMYPAYRLGSEMIYVTNTIYIELIDYTLMSSLCKEYNLEIDEDRFMRSKTNSITICNKLRVLDYVTCAEVDIALSVAHC